jgi:hypothetical protein
MRSELIFRAVAHEPNRYRLVKLLAKGTRGMHRPYTRLQDTMNEVLQRFGRSPGVAVQMLSSTEEQDRRAA